MSFSRWVYVSFAATLAAGCLASPVPKQNGNEEEPTEPAKKTTTKDGGAPKTTTQPTTQLDAGVSVALSVTLLTPSTAVAGTSALALTIAGSGFTNGARVDLGGTEVPSTLQSDRSISIQVPAAKVVNAGSLAITVIANGTRSNTAFLVISTAASTVSVTSLSPSSAVANASATPLSLVVQGAGFTQSSRVLVAAQELPTTFQSATTLQATIPANLLTAPATYAVAVRDGTSTSAAQNFQVTPATPNPNGTCESVTTRSACLTQGCGWVEAAGPCITVNPGGGTCGGQTGRSSCLTAGCGWIEPAGPCIDP